MQLRVLEDRPVQHVLQAGLEVAVEVGGAQHVVVFLQTTSQCFSRMTWSMRQRAGLVGAEDIHRAEVLDGVEPLDDDLLARHRERALGQADRHDHRQHLRRQADRHRHGEEERLAPVPLGEPVDDEDQRHHDEHEADHQPGELRDAPVEAGRRPAGRQAPAMPPRYVSVPVATTTAVAEPLSTLVPRKQTLVSSSGERPLGLRGRELLDRKRLAGQAALDHEQVLGRR